MEAELISVIVPIYNVEPYLRKCVDSILAQAYTNFEAILVDDGSPDSCGAICDEYAQKDNRVRVIHKENGGVSAARNTALDVAAGEYITFVDADDFIPSNYLEALHNGMADDVDMVRCNAENYLLDIRGGGHVKLPFKPLIATVVLDSSDPRNFGDYIHYCGWGVLYKRSAIGDLRFNTSYYVGEDTLFYYSALKRCSRIKHIKSTVYCYVERQDSAMHSSFSEKRYDEIYAWRDACRLYEDNDEIRKMIESEYVLRCHIMLNLIRYSGTNDTEKIKFLKREIHRLLPQGLKLKHGCHFISTTRIGFILDAFVPEKAYRFIMMSYYFIGNRKLYEQLKKRENEPLG